MRSRMWTLFVAVLAVATIHGQDTAESIVRQAIKASGYSADDKPYHLTWREQGKMNFGGGELPYDARWAFEPANKMRFEMNAEFGGQKVNIIFILNGDKAKETSMGNTQMLEGEKLEEMVHSCYVFWASLLTPLVNDKAFKLKLLGDKEFAGKPVVSVEVSREGRRTFTLHFDKKTHMLAGCSERVKDEFQGWKEVPQESIYQEYEKQPNGEMMHKTATVKRDGNVLLESKFSEWKRSDVLKPESFKLD